MSEPSDFGVIFGQQEPPTLSQSTVPAIPGGAPFGGASQDTPLRQRLGLWMTADHRYWWQGMGPFPSVTTVLEILSKPALNEWFKWTVARLAVSQIHELARILQDEGTDAAVKWLAGMPGYTRDKAAQLGTGVHLLANMVSRGQDIDSGGFPIPEGAAPLLEGYGRFLERYGASSIVSSEKAIFNLAVGYAGTFDFLMLIDGELWLIDVKTGKGVYPEMALQLVAYGNGEFIALPGDPTRYRMPIIERYGILHLREDAGYPEHWKLIEYRVDVRDWIAFVSALDLWGWRAEGRHKG